MASERVDAQRSTQPIQPLQIQGRLYPPLAPPTAPAEWSVGGLELLIPPHFCHMSLLIFNISHHGTFRKYKEIITVAILPC